MNHVRNLVLALCCALAASEAAAAAPQPEGPKNTVTVLPLAAAVGFYSFEYERAVSDSLSLFASPAYMQLGLFKTGVGVRAYTMELGGRYFLTGRAPEGLWLGASGEIGQVRAAYKALSAEATGYAVAGSFGFTWLIGDVVDVSMGVGLRHYAYGVDFRYDDGERSAERERGLSGSLPFLRLALGVAF